MSARPPWFTELSQSENPDASIRVTFFGMA